MARSAYNAHFCATVKCNMACSIWKSCAPLKIKLFLWLVVRGRVWTDDRLAKHGLTHKNACCFCHNSQENSTSFRRMHGRADNLNTVLQWARLSEVAPQDIQSHKD